MDGRGVGIGSLAGSWVELAAVQRMQKSHGSKKGECKNT